MNTAQDVARYIVRVFQEAGDPPTNLKVQKLLYYVQGWHLALKKREAFADRLEAWVHGPVQPGVYGSFKHYRWNPIVDDLPAVTLEADTKEVADSVIETYGGETGYQLELRTHQERPWLEARGKLPPDAESNQIIPVAALSEFFGELAGGNAK